jgi:drug/metabolite transporter (DMT)-like permease
MSALPARSAAALLAGIGFLMTAVSLFALLDTTVKYLSTLIPVLMVLWARYTFQALAVTATMLPHRGWSLLRTRHPRLQLLRGTLLLLCSMFAFFALKYLPVAEFTAMAMVAPLAVTAVSAWFFKEDVSALRWALVVGGFGGALLILRPGNTHLGWAVLLPVGQLVAYTGFQLLASRMAKYEDPDTTLFYTGWVGCIVTSIGVPWVWVDVNNWQTIGFMLLAGAFGTVGHWFFILAFARTPASTLMPFQYVQIAVAMGLGWLVFGHLPDSMAVAGIALIALCGAAGAWLTARECRISLDPQEV